MIDIYDSEFDEKIRITQKKDWIYVHYSKRVGGGFIKMKRDLWRQVAHTVIGITDKDWPVIGERKKSAPVSEGSLR